MNTFITSKALAQIFNTVGNKWIEEHLNEASFNFRVYLRKTGHDEEHLGDYLAEVYTDRFIPRKMTYTKNDRKKKVSYEFLREKLMELTKYITTEPIEVKLMEVDYR